MERPYLIIVNGILAGRKLTRGGALKVVKSFTDRGVNAGLAYELENGKFESISLKGV